MSSMTTQSISYTGQRPTEILGPIDFIDTESLLKIEDFCSDSGSSVLDSEESPRSKRKRRTCGSDSDREACSLSEILDKSVASPPIQHEQKKKRRKRAKTEEEKQQRAEERKIKNRQSAMRSRQRVLNELKKDKDEIKRLQSENEEQAKIIQQLTDELRAARNYISELHDGSAKSSVAGSLSNGGFDDLTSFLPPEFGSQGSAVLDRFNSFNTVNFDLSNLDQMKDGMENSTLTDSLYNEKANFGSAKGARMFSLVSEILRNPERQSFPSKRRGDLRHHLASIRAQKLNQSLLKVS